MGIYERLYKGMIVRAGIGAKGIQVVRNLNVGEKRCLEAKTLMKH